MYELITLNNQFLNLCVLDEENKIKEITGFSGSNAKLLKGKEKSYLFTDKRYELQAKSEINDKNIEVVFESFNNWATENKDKKIYYNPWCHSIEEVKSFGKNFVAKAKEPEYVIDKCPFEYEIEYAGLSASEKVADMLSFMKAKGLDAYIITDATDVSWILNLRSEVLAHSPVFRAFAVLNKKGEMHLFNHPKQMKKYKAVGLNDKTTPAIFAKYVKNYKYPRLPLLKKRFSKSELEIDGFKNAHIKDGIAITKLLYWLYNDNKTKKELEVAQKLQSLRAEQEGFFAPSFGSIIAFGKNSALPHYQPCKNKSEKIGKGMLLIDVGAHFFGGTTDMTRTICLGKPTKEQIKYSTLVLQGHIRLATQKFAFASNGQQLDILARGPLLNEGLDYNHGTGHGVGNFLCVHESPSISKNSTTPIYENVVTSIEPAVYFEGKYGIRIENLYRTKNEQNNLLSFENLTYVPFDNSLIDFKRLTNIEKDFVINYQKQVYQTLEKHLSKNEKVWLKKYISINS